MGAAPSGSGGGESYDSAVEDNSGTVDGSAQKGDAKKVGSSSGAYEPTGADIKRFNRTVSELKKDVLSTDGLDSDVPMIVRDNTYGYGVDGNGVYGRNTDGNIILTKVHFNRDGSIRLRDLVDTFSMRHSIIAIKIINITPSVILLNLMQLT